MLTAEEAVILLAIFPKNIKILFDVSGNYIHFSCFCCKKKKFGIEYLKVTFCYKMLCFCISAKQARTAIAAERRE